MVSADGKGVSFIPNSTPVAVLLWGLFDWLKRTWRRLDYWLDVVKSSPFLFFVTYY